MTPTCFRAAASSVTALAMAFMMASPAAAAPDDGRLRMVRTDRPVLIHREVIHPRDRYHRGYREDIVQQGREMDMYIMRGNVRLTEEDFLSLVARSGTDPQLIQMVQNRASSAFTHGGLALGSWLGAGISGAIAEIEFGPDSPLVARTGASQVAVNTAGIIAIAFAVSGIIWTLFWMGDTRQRGAPFFRNFTPGEAQSAIDAFNARGGSRVLFNPSPEGLAAFERASADGTLPRITTN